MKAWARNLWMAGVLFIAPFLGIGVAQIISALPVTLQNGTLADANQVMSNFNAIVSNVNANAAKNGINSDITALTALSTPLTAVQGGSTFYYAGTSAGSNNVQTTGAPVPAGFTLTAGVRLGYIANTNNTGNLTINVNGLGAKNVFRPLPGGTTGLGGGEIQTGMFVILAYDGTQFQLMNSALPDFPGTSVVYRGLTQPVGYLFEDGSCQLRANYPALFGVIGTTYSTCGGDPTMFGLPDSRGRMDAGRDDMGGSAANRITNAGSGCTGTTLALGCGAQNTTSVAAHTHPSSTVTADAHFHFAFADEDPNTGAPTNANASSQSPSRNSAGGAAIGFNVTNTGTAATVTRTSSASGFVTLSANTGSTGLAAMPMLNPLLIANKIIRY